MQAIHQTALNFFEQHFPFSGSVLEIGSDFTGDVCSYVRDKGARVSALNPTKEFVPPPGVAAYRDDARDLKSFGDNTFDAVISINTFEHIHALHVALAEIARVLKPGGYLGALFGPIFSSAKGHHLWAKHGDDIVSFWRQDKRNPLDDYSHLTMTPREMREDLAAKGEKPGMIEAIVTAVYMRDDLNRWMHRHYEKAIADMPLEVVKLEPNNRFEVPADIDARMKARWGDHDFGITSLRLIARKA